MGYKIEWLDKEFRRGIVTQTRWFRASRTAEVYLPEHKSRWVFAGNQAVVEETNCGELDAWLDRQRNLGIWKTKTDGAWQEVRPLPKARVNKC